MLVASSCVSLKAIVKIRTQLLTSYFLPYAKSSELEADQTRILTKVVIYSNWKWKQKARRLFLKKKEKIHVY